MYVCTYVRSKHGVDTYFCTYNNTLEIFFLYLRIIITYTVASASSALVICIEQNKRQATRTPLRCCTDNNDTLLSC